MSFQQALSGLSAASTNLDTIGNNVANSNTVGFKEGRAEFADLFANALNGGSNNQLGLGARVAQIAQQFTQGNLQTTSNPLDTGINGNGFFRVSTNGTIAYSRDGQFQVDKSGYLINSTGAQITGYPADTKGVIQQGSPQPLQINTADLVPQATANVKQVMNLDSRDTPKLDSTGLAVKVFNPADASTFNKQTTTTIYDSLGDPTQLNVYYQLQPTGGGVQSGTWNVFATTGPDATGVYTPVTVTGGIAVTDATGAIIPNAAAQVVFSSAGAVASSTPAAFPFPLSVTLSNGATSPLDFNLDLTGTTQVASVYAQTSGNQDGIKPGQLTGFAIGADGTIQGNYSNGLSQPLGQVVLASFANVNGLQPIGNNAWSQTVASGQPLVGTPESGNLGSLQSSALEQSNVDLTAELVNMITAQRAYQANAQTIKTQDQILQTITSLR